jgi:APA family basic amino acid/polyamine antiporter
LPGWNGCRNSDDKTRKASWRLSSFLAEPMRNFPFQTKRPEQLLREAEEPNRQLKRELTAVDLTALGIGAIIGAGIFATTGSAAAGTLARPGAGPALIVSYLLTAVACSFCALCYAEFASMIPVSGSAYTYAYATMGELVAWIIGWDLIIEYAIGNVAVAVSWAGYFKELLSGFEIELPDWLTTDYRTAQKSVEILVAAPHLGPIPIVVNLPAILIVALITIVLVIGIKESARFNSAMVLTKLAVIVGFIVVGAFYVKPSNWHPFAPNGWSGITTGAALIFFAYIGFDAISTTAEEARNPQRDMPIGMIASLGICTFLYILTTAVLTGIVPFRQLGTAEPLATALNAIQLDWAAGIVSFGAVVSMTAVLLVFQLGQPRIFFAMSRDGLLPDAFAAVHPRFRTPHITTILTGIVVAALAGFMDINEAVELTNIGTLFAFVLVGVGVIILRSREPDRPRPFRCPAVPWIPLLGIGSCAYLMTQLPLLTWVRFLVWLFIGLVIYFLYGAERSDLSQQAEEDQRPALHGQLVVWRRCIGVLLLIASAVLFYSGLMKHAGLSGRIGQALAIPFVGDTLHRSLIWAGSVMLMLSLIFFGKAASGTQRGGTRNRL